MITICPHCDGVSNTQTPVGENTGPPENGDASVCANCGETNIYDDTTPAGIRTPTETEQTEIATNPGIRAARTIIALRNM